MITVICSSSDSEFSTKAGNESWVTTATPVTRCDIDTIIKAARSLLEGPSHRSETLKPNGVNGMI